MRISNKSINVAIALVIDILVITIIALTNPEVTKELRTIVLIAVNNAFVWTLYLLTFPMEPDKKRKKN